MSLQAVLLFPAETIPICPVAMDPAEVVTLDRSPALTGTVGDPAAVLTATIEGNTYPVTNNGDGTWALAGNTITPDVPIYVDVPVVIQAVCPGGERGTAVGKIVYPNVLIEDVDGTLITDADGFLFGDNQP